MRKLILTWLLICSLALAGCSSGTPAEPEQNDGGQTIEEVEEPVQEE